ncbi:MAG: acyl--CoA ligase [Clostridia bacterium]|nr:acyl--CoA ligase [Clostridia bacterium]
MSLYEVRQFNNFPELINSSVGCFGNSVAFSQKKGDAVVTYTYEQFKSAVISFGSALHKAGFAESRIAICAGNSIGWCISYMAGAVYCKTVVPIDKELTGENIISTVKKADAKVLITDAKTFDKLPEYEGLTVIGIDFENETVKPLSSFLDGIELLPMPVKEAGAPSVMLFTSGTTGKSKAVVLSQENICFDISAVMKIVKINHGERILSLLPLHHTYECSISFLCCFYAGVNICFGGGIRDIYKDFKLFSPHALVLVPLILKGLAAKFKKLPPLPDRLLRKRVLDFFGGNLRLVVCGAAPIEGDVLKEVSRFIPTIIQGYGLTECSPIALCNPDFDFAMDSVGKPLPQTQAKIINPDENGTGEICVKGEMVMVGYFDGEEIHDMRDDDGWFHTGDLGFCDKKGNYHITGRLKNVIVTPNGKNIYPEELELQLGEFKEITECMVFEGVDQRGSAAVWAKIVTKADADKVQKIIKKVNSKNAPYKAIKGFEICDELPKNTSLKIIRNK